MADKGAFDRLSEAELAHHRHDLRYAQVQVCKRGDHETVARGVRRRAGVGLCITLSMLVVVAVATLLGWLDWMPLALVVVAVLESTYGYIQAQRTAETVRRLTEEKEAARRGGPD